MGAIEDLIQQVKFKSEHHRAIVSLIYAGNLVNDYHNNYLKSYGITGQQFNVLRILRGQHPKPATINLIRERMLDKNSDVSRIVERMRKSGMIDRVTCQQDRRAVDIIITSKGLALLKEIDEDQLQFEKPIKSLTSADIKQLNSLLDKVLTSYTSQQ